MRFLKKLFGLNPKPAPRRPATRLTLETFETRDLPSAGGVVAGARAFAADRAAQVGAAFAGVARGCQGQQAQTLTATLTGDAGTGSVSFTANARTRDNSLSVQVSGLSADTNYTVSDGTNTLGTITTDANGGGTLAAEDLVTPLTAGATISVLDDQVATVLSGTLATPAPAVTHLSVTLTGAEGTSGQARFRANATTGENGLKVSVAGLGASQTFSVRVDGTAVGALTTDANGRGRVALSNVTSTVAAGSVLTVQDATGTTVLEGTFAATTGGGRRR